MRQFLGVSTANINPRTPMLVEISRLQPKTAVATDTMPMATAAMAVQTMSRRFILGALTSATL